MGVGSLTWGGSGFFGLPRGMSTHHHGKFHHKI